MQKTVLFIAYYFPPIATSGTFRALNFCRYLPFYGWTPQVLTTTPISVYPQLPEDQLLCLGLPADMRVDRVGHPNPENELNKIVSYLRSMLRLLPQQAEINEPAMRNSPNIMIKPIDHLLERLLKFPDPQCFWRQPALRRLGTVCRANRPDVVFATGKPWTALLIGKIVAQRFGVPFVADFRDPWVRNPTSSVSRSAKRFERKICRAAARVITTTRELRDQLTIDYPDLRERVVTISNGFDSAEYSTLDCIAGSTADSNRARCKPILELSHFGSIYGNRSPLALLTAMRELFLEQRVTPNQIHVRFIGAWEPDRSISEGVIRELETAGLVTREPPLPHAECLTRMSKADMLLLLQSAYPLQIPAKIYEYIAVGRPVLLLGGEGATANLFNQYKLGVCCSNKVNLIKEILLKLLKRTITIELPPSSSRDRFDYRNLTGDLASVLDEVCTGR